MTVFQTLKLIWKRFWRRHKVDNIVVLESMADLPKRLRHDLYVVGDPNPKWAILACPCGCGERIDVSLRRGQKATWRLEAMDGRATLYPSLWMPKEKCGSHFWLRSNRIQWVDAPLETKSVERRN